MRCIEGFIVSMFDILGFSSLILEEDLRKIYDYTIDAKKLTETNSNMILLYKINKEILDMKIPSKIYII